MPNYTEPSIVVLRQIWEGESRPLYDADGPNDGPVSLTRHPARF